MKLSQFFSCFRVSVYSFALLFGVWSSSFADENAQGTKKDATPASASTAEASSQEKGSFYIAPTFDPIVGAGGRTGYRLGNWAMELIYTQSVGYMNNPKHDNGADSTRYQLGTVNAKYFVAGSSFYVAWGLGLGRENVDYGIPIAFGPLIGIWYTGTTTYRDTLFDSYIGNQWTFQHFTIGADWIGFYNVMSQSEESTTWKNSYGEKPIPLIPILCRFYAGVSF